MDLQLQQDLSYIQRKKLLSRHLALGKFQLMLALRLLKTIWARFILDQVW